MSEPANVIVIGGGIIGCWSAWHLQRLGARVTMIDRGRIGGGASWGNCGYICPSHVHPLPGPGAVAAGLKTMAKFGGALSIPPRWDPMLWRWLWSFAKHCNPVDFRNASDARHALLASSRRQYQLYAEQHADAIKWQSKGLLTVYQSRQAFESYQRHADQLHQDFGVAVNRVNGDALCDLEPTLRSGLAGGWHFPNDAHLSPYDLIECLRRDLVESGCQLREQVAVKRFRCSGSSVSSLELDDGEFLTADAFVLTTGAEAAELGKMLDCNLPVVPGKGYSVTFDDAQGMPQTPMIFEADHVAVTPLGNSFRIGSTMQLTGYSRTIPKARIELLKRSAREHLRHPLPQANEQAWCGWRPMMPDGVPCIDRSPKSGNAFIASGNGMIGMATGPGTGQLVAELVLGRTPHIDPNPYRAGRFK